MTKTTTKGKQQIAASVHESIKDAVDWMNTFFGLLDDTEGDTCDHIDHFQIVPHNGYFHIVVVYHEVSLAEEQPA
jgi:hypothetical protein